MQFVRKMNAKFNCENEHHGNQSRRFSICRARKHTGNLTLLHWPNKSTRTLQRCSRNLLQPCTTRFYVSKGKAWMLLFLNLHWNASVNKGHYAVISYSANTKQSKSSCWKWVCPSTDTHNKKGNHSCFQFRFPFGVSLVAVNLWLKKEPCQGKKGWEWHPGLFTCISWECNEQVAWTPHTRACLGASNHGHEPLNKKCMLVCQARKACAFWPKLLHQCHLELIIPGNRSSGKKIIRKIQLCVCVCVCVFNS